MEDVRLPLTRIDKAKERIEARADRPHGVGHRSTARFGTPSNVAFSLTVQRLVLAELLEHDHRQQAGPASLLPPAWNGAGAVASIFVTVAARELLAQISIFFH